MIGIVASFSSSSSSIRPKLVLSLVSSTTLFRRPSNYYHAAAAFSTTTTIERSLSTSSIGQSLKNQRQCSRHTPLNNRLAAHYTKRRQTSLYWFSSSKDDNDASTQTKEDDEKNNPLLLLDPKAPLRPLLAENCHENHLSQYTLPPTEIGRDDYRPNLKRGQRIVSFGDVHGDIDALRSFLITAEILDPESTNDEPIWSGGETICVQTGDVLDRGDDELACFRLLATLARQAKKAGGALLLLYGNHESLNAAGLFQYANPGGNSEFEKTIGARIDYNYGSNRWRLQFAGNEPSRWASFEPGGLLAENMLGNMLVACVVGRTVFVHAGLTASHLKGGNGIDENGEMRYGGISKINEEAREWILKGECDDDDDQTILGFYMVPLSCCSLLASYGNINNMYIMFPTFALKPITEITITGENLIPSRKLLPRLRIVPRLLPRPCQIVSGAVLVPHLPCG